MFLIVLFLSNYTKMVDVTFGSKFSQKFPFFLCVCCGKSYGCRHWSNNETQKIYILRENYTWNDWMYIFIALDVMDSVYYVISRKV